MVIKESLRLYPPVPFAGRQLLEDAQIGDYMIPKGTDIWLNYYALHRNPDQWTEPEKFDPERFSPENSIDRHPFAFVPFGGGLRNYIEEYFPDRCWWTNCEAIMRVGTSICEQYGFDFYAQQSRIADCSTFTSQVLCCRIETLRRECDWSTSCYHQTSITPEFACGTEFGQTFEATRKLLCGSYVEDNSLNTFRYECCPANITN
ncbi:Cytochrome P450 4C1 [Pseudolycoriella hygida]|uniref:Cytochrome P450 4C1 n=1 Tax=Pseudolycoriella hygida TaxID=35572 RepID=A0A9Q0S3I8_9DIPT|nr:Cytochrome P450 4C1 [Pseudolycoriella hygida]